jgi:hypothetical protein
LLQHELERDELAELEVRRGDDDTHAADAEHTLDAEFPRKDVSRLDRIVVAHQRPKE